MCHIYNIELNQFYCIVYKKKKIKVSSIWNVLLLPFADNYSYLLAREHSKVISFDGVLTTTRQWLNNQKLIKEVYEHRDRITFSQVNK